MLNRLVSKMPEEECYLEVGTLEGRTIEAAAHGNERKWLVACDPGDKYHAAPGELGHNITFYPTKWQEVLSRLTLPIGLMFYDGDHSERATVEFMQYVLPYMAREAVLVLDDWDRTEVRSGAFAAGSGWRLLREMPAYTDGLSCPPDHFGYYFGVAVWGWARDIPVE